MTRHMTGLACAFALVMAIAPFATADLSNVIYEVAVCRPGGQCLGGVQIAADDPRGHGWWEGGDYHWMLDEDITIYDYATGTVEVGYVRATGSTLDIVEDPVVDLGFSVQAGATATQFSIASAKLSFATIAAATGSANTAYNLTDWNGDEATLTGLFAGGGAYKAQYNGFPNGTLFSELITSPITAGSFESMPANGTYSAAIAGSVSDMSARIEFELSAEDLASGTSTFEITPIPEPAGLLLLVVGGALLRRR